MKCREHSHLEASGMCVECGNPKCENCIVDVGGRNHCKQCLKQTKGKSNNPSVVINNSNASSASASSSSSAKSTDASSVAWGIGACCCLIVIFLMLAGSI